MKNTNHSIISNPIINKTGLACRVWDDAKPEVLRKRLDDRFIRQTLRPEEKAAIIQELEQLLKQAHTELGPE